MLARSKPFETPAPEAEDRKAARRAAAFRRLEAAEAAHGKAVAAAERRIDAAAKILKPFEDARRAIAEARQASADAAAHYRAEQGRCIAEARDAAPGELLAIVERLRQAQKDLLARPLDGDPAAAKRATATAEQIVTLMREANALMELPASPEAIAALKARANAVVFA
jgi:hypothetical protein